MKFTNTFVNVSENGKLVGDTNFFDSINASNSFDTIGDHPVSANIFSGQMIVAKNKEDLNKIEQYCLKRYEKIISLVNHTSFKPKFTGLRSADQLYYFLNWWCKLHVNNTLTNINFESIELDYETYKLGLGTPPMSEDEQKHYNSLSKLQQDNIYFQVELLMTGVAGIQDYIADPYKFRGSLKLGEIMLFPHISEEKNARVESKARKLTANLYSTVGCYRKFVDPIKTRIGIAFNETGEMSIQAINKDEPEQVKIANDIQKKVNKYTQNIIEDSYGKNFVDISNDKVNDKQKQEVINLVNENENSNINRNARSQDNSKSKYNHRSRTGSMEVNRNQRNENNSKLNSKSNPSANRSLNISAQSGSNLNRSNSVNNNQSNNPIGKRPSRVTKLVWKSEILTTGYIFPHDRVPPVKHTLYLQASQNALFREYCDKRGNYRGIYIQKQEEYNTQHGRKKIGTASGC